MQAGVADGRRGHPAVGPDHPCAALGAAPPRHDGGAAELGGPRCSCCRCLRGAAGDAPCTFRIRQASIIGCSWLAARTDTALAPWDLPGSESCHAYTTMTPFVHAVQGFFHPSSFPAWKQAQQQGSEPVVLHAQRGRPRGKGGKGGSRGCCQPDATGVDLDLVQQVQTCTSGVCSRCSRVEGASLDIRHGPVYRSHAHMLPRCLPADGPFQHTHHLWLRDLHPAARAASA